MVYCTGGVRCEKFSGWMVREGYKDVGQLHGGIATYGKDPEVQGELWDGKMYVFDERIAVDVNHVNPTIVGKDWFDGTPCERYVNCGNPFCNRRILASEENEDKYLRGCSHECRVHPRNRYVSENELTQAEVVERLAAIGEAWIKQLLYKIKQSLGAVFLCFLLKNLKFVSISFRKIRYTICKRFQRSSVMVKTFFIPNKQSILGEQEILTAKSILGLVDGLESHSYDAVYLRQPINRLEYIECAIVGQSQFLFKVSYADGQKAYRVDLPDLLTKTDWQIIKSF